MATDTYASLNGNLGIAAYLNFKFMQLLHDIGDLKSVCTYLPFTPDAGSASMKIRQVQPVDPFTAPGEDTAPAITSTTTGSATITVAKANLYRSMTDLALITNEIDVEVAVASFAKSLVYYRSSLIAALGAGFTSNTAVGSTGVALSVDTVLAAQFALQVANANQLKLVMHQKSLGDLQQSVRSETGTPFSWDPASLDLIKAKDFGTIQGSWNGIELHTHKSVPKINTNADYSNFMVGDQAIGFTEAPVRLLAQYAFNPQILAGEEAMICQDLSTESKGSRSWICHYYPGVAELEDARGIQIVSGV